MEFLKIFYIIHAVNYINENSCGWLRLILQYK